GMHVPVIACSDLPEAQDSVKDWSMISALLSKPVSIDQFTYIVKGITTAPVIAPSHVPVKVQMVLDHANGGFDFYLRLSKDNFVKIVKKDDFFTEEDVQKLVARGSYHVQIRASESHEFLRICEKNLLALNTSNLVDKDLGISLAIESLEQVETMAKAF